MTKRDAKRLACRVASRQIERYLALEIGDSDLSDADIVRLEEALEELQDELMRRGGADDPH